jgi:hypothetical protein
MAEDVCDEDATTSCSMRSSATAQIEHSFSKGLVDLYQRVIADPTNSGVSFFCGFW